MGSNTLAVRGWRRARQTCIHPPTLVGAHTAPTHGFPGNAQQFFPQKPPKIYQLPEIKGYRSLGLRGFHDKEYLGSPENLKLMIFNYFDVTILTWLLR